MISILCPALTSRIGLSPILADLHQQCLGADAELLVLMDNGAMSIGAKCNALVSMASGTHIAFVADDDRVAPDYVSSLVEAAPKAQAVTFTVEYSEAGERPNPFGTHRVALREDIDLWTVCLIDAGVVRGFTFPDSCWKEDRAFMVYMSRQGLSKVRIPRALYHVNVRKRKPEFGGRNYRHHGDSLCA